MDGSPFLPLCAELHIERVTETPTGLVVSVLSLSSQACCPLCEQTAERKHSRYIRCITDLPCTGRQVTLLLSLCKYFCQNSACPRKIFTERLPELVQSSARLTNRVRNALVAFGFATCGEGLSRLAPQLGMQVTPTTIIRRLRAVPSLPPITVKRLGVDDWAWKKGHTYGTILVDLDLHRPIELLPDRSEETLEAWLRTHPEIETVSRDRAGAYAEAARKGAPQAQQVADRFHLLKNLREDLKDVMDRMHLSLPEVEERTSDAIPAKAQGIKEISAQQQPLLQAENEREKHYRTIPPSPYQRPAGIPTSEVQKQARRDKRSALYENVRALFEQGLSVSAIAHQLHLCRETVRKFLRAQEYPEMHHRKRGEKRSILDSYKLYILQRWQQGCRNSVQLYDEINARGFKGAISLLRKFLAELRKKHQEAGSASALMLTPCGTSLEVSDPLPPRPRITRRLSPTRASWLFVSQTKRLDEKQLHQVDQIRAGHPDLEAAYQLGQAFVMMLAERRETDLDAWLAQAEQSGLPEFKKLANGIRRDYTAVRAAFSSEMSNDHVA